MATLTFGGCKPPEKVAPRGALLRLLDTFAEWQMRHSHSVISRVQPNDAAVINSVTQPSSSNDRSSTKP